MRDLTANSERVKYTKALGVGAGCPVPLLVIPAPLPVSDFPTTAAGELIISTFFRIFFFSRESVQPRSSLPCPPTPSLSGIISPSGSPWASGAPTDTGR